MSRSLRLRCSSAVPVCLLATVLGGTALAAQPDPHVIFAPLTLPQPVNLYHSGSGAPGPAAWQNRADYAINVGIDPVTHTLSGSEVLTYTNNSPDELFVLWVQLDQNMYALGSRGAFANPNWLKHHTGGVMIDSVSLLSNTDQEIAVKPFISDTRMQVPLEAPLSSKGGKTRLKISWHYTIPPEWGGRTAYSHVPEGEVYEIAQFYPRMAVYDDMRGWDTAPYLGQEFYLDYGDIEYSVTVPSGFLVVGSGSLTNPQEVLTQQEQARLAQAAQSETRVLIRNADEVKALAAHPALGTQTWRFRMHNTRDVAFVASPALMWDAAKLDLPPLAPEAPTGKTVPRLAMSVYPLEAAGAQKWDRSTEYAKHAIEYFSQQWFAYPWPNAINVGGHGAAMEYPGIVFDGKDDAGAELFWVTTHELGHSWFPMIVGSNERRNAFMDEGFNTFIDVYASAHFNHGEYAPKQDVEYAPKTGNPAEDSLEVLKDPAAPPLMTPADLVPEKYRHGVTYFKGAYGLTLLREQIVGPERFDRAFKRYIALWAYKHPTPSDFFRLMESESGEDLSWFWRGWYFNNWGPDYAVDGVSYINANPTQGALVHVVNKGWLPLPVVLSVTWVDGSSARVRIPTETWYQKNEVNLQIPGQQAIRSVVLDPDHVIPDLNRADNSFDVKAPQPAQVQPDSRSTQAVAPAPVESTPQKAPVLQGPAGH
ncbi:M1 family metallopeptidase [Acetobacter orientalis]|uniref:M1 family metallopeptidase n=1 Tax=Acetobacter orientalis TaxID=146474 RepID=UPI00353141BC